MVGLAFERKNKVSTAEIEIRPAQLMERPEVDLLVRRCGKHVRDYFGIRTLDEFFSKGHVWVLVDEDIIAFAVAVPLKKTPTISLYEIGVDPDHRQKGHAKRLLKHIQEEYPDREYRFVVNENNVEGRTAYKKMGFQVEKYDVTKSGRCIVRMIGKI